MRSLAAAFVIVLFAPLSACYVGNTPPVSRRADASPDPRPGDAAVTDDAQPADDAASPMCARDEDCGEGARCVTGEGAPYCEVVPPAADAGAPDAGRPYDCRELCMGRACGLASSPACDLVDCGSCAEGYECSGLYRCEWQGARWAVRVVSAHVDRCDTSWDQCPHGGAPLCAPSLPDPFVRFAGGVTTPAGNRCDDTYNQEMGVFDEPQLTGGMDFVLEDDDSVVSNVRGGDVVCRGRVTFTAAELAAGSKTASCDGGSVTFAVTRRR